MIIRPIASGSSGNAYYISDGKSSLLLDAGIPLAKIQAGCGYCVSKLSGCLVTHAHSDHVKAAKDLAKLGVDIYTSQGTIDMANLIGHRIHKIKALEQFETDSFTILPFDVEHDVPEPLGFLIYSKETKEKLLYVTDTYYIRYRFKGLTHILIEANYDQDALLSNAGNNYIDSGRAKRVITSHMSIDTTIQTLESFDLSLVRQIYLLHLSNDNGNAEVFKERVQAITGKEVYIC